MLCDVLDMSACHILLGRPWQYDKRVKHDGFTNIYTLRHEGKLKDLIPLPPHKAIPPFKNKQPVHLMIRKSYVNSLILFSNLDRYGITVQMQLENLLNLLEAYKKMHEPKEQTNSKY